MLPTFVIGLREGLEAALIVGIIAAFLRKQGRDDLLRQMALGVSAAVAICAAGGLALELFSRDLPQRQQEGLETVIGIIAVGMVTYMVIWMKGHSRGLKTALESMAADAITGTSSRAGTAMVVMGGLAVFREGFETVVFLLAAFHETGSGGSAIAGALLGLGVSVALGYGIYRGGVRINLSKFFRATGLVLVLVAGGLVVSAIHTAHEAGWLVAGQYQMFDLSWLVQPGSVTSSLLTGMLGVQPYPVLAEVLGWLLYVIPVGLFVAWAPGAAVPMRALQMALASGAVIALSVSAAMAALMPTTRSTAPATRAGAVSAQVTGHRGTDLLVRTQAKQYRLQHTGSHTVAGQPALTYASTHTSSGTGPATITAAEVARLNGGRLPLGVQPSDGGVPARYRDVHTLTVSIEPQTDRVLALSRTQRRFVQAIGSSGQLIDAAVPISTTSYRFSQVTSVRAATAAREELDRRATRDQRQALAVLFGVLGSACALGLASGLIRGSRKLG